MNTANPPLELGLFLKWVAAVDTGGQAKLIIQDGQVLLNGAVETRRRKKLVLGDRVTWRGRTWVVGDQT